MDRYLTYEQFGAVGDGIHDDFSAIADAHEEANRLNLPVRAREGAVYYLSPRALTVTVMTSVSWTGAKFIIDDRDCEDRTLQIFKFVSREEPVALEITALKKGQTHLDNPWGRDLHVRVFNENHRDFIRFGLNQDSGSPRMDVFILRADGSIPSGVSWEFDRVTKVIAMPMDTETLTVTGGEFLTVANRWESKYDYHNRGIQISRSNVRINGLTHLVEGELDHGAPYGGFLTISACADVEVTDCVFTGHRTYFTIGSAGLPVGMGSYDLNCSSAVNIRFKNCTQTTDILDRRYWGLIGTNRCRDLCFEDCVMSRFDAHTGVTNCVLRRCTLGHQALNAIGFGTLTVEDCHIHGWNLICLRPDYGSTWDGDFVIRNCVWHPMAAGRPLFYAENDGHHDFGYECTMTRNIFIDGLEIQQEEADDSTLYVFTDYLGSNPAPEAERKLKPHEPESIIIRNFRTNRAVELCPNPQLLKNTKFECECV